MARSAPVDGQQGGAVGSEWPKWMLDDAARAEATQRAASPEPSQRSGPESTGAKVAAGAIGLLLIVLIVGGFFYLLATADDPAPKDDPLTNNPHYEMLMNQSRNKAIEACKLQALQAMPQTVPGEYETTSKAQRYFNACMAGKGWAK